MEEKNFINIKCQFHQEEQIQYISLGYNQFITIDEQQQNVFCQKCLKQSKSGIKYLVNLEKLITDQGKLNYPKSSQLFSKGFQSVYQSIKDMDNFKKLSCQILEDIKIKFQDYIEETINKLRKVQKQVVIQTENYLKQKEMDISNIKQYQQGKFDTKKLFYMVQEAQSHKELDNRVKQYLQEDLYDIRYNIYIELESQINNCQQICRDIKNTLFLGLQGFQNNQKLQDLKLFKFEEQYKTDIQEMNIVMPFLRGDKLNRFNSIIQWDQESGKQKLVFFDQKQLKNKEFLSQKFELNQGNQYQVGISMKFCIPQEYYNNVRRRQDSQYQFVIGVRNEKSGEEYFIKNKEELQAKYFKLTQQEKEEQEQLFQIRMNYGDPHWFLSNNVFFVGIEYLINQHQIFINIIYYIRGQQLCRQQITQQFWQSQKLLEQILFQVQQKIFGTKYAKKYLFLRVEVVD